MMGSLLDRVADSRAMCIRVDDHVEPEYVWGMHDVPV
jgi:hypothetical protein